MTHSALAPIPDASETFRLDGHVVVVTGGYGVLGSAMSRGLRNAGASVVLLGRSLDKANAAAVALDPDGDRAFGVAADVLDEDGLADARDAVLDRYGRIDALVNAAGGNVSGATLAPGASPFGLDADAWRSVVDLNLHGTILPTQAFGPALAEGAAGAVVNVSSMAASRVISRVAGYSAAKAAVDHYTRWMAVELAKQTGGRVRVNAVAPGFFVAEQNRDLLASMDRRAKLQLRLQKTVEGLSTAAITYYLVILVGYLARGVSDAGVARNADIVRALTQSRSNGLPDQPRTYNSNIKLHSIYPSFAAV